jgi:hypothetical protein
LGGVLFSCRHEVFIISIKKKKKKKKRFTSSGGVSSSASQFTVATLFGRNFGGSPHCYENGEWRASTLIDPGPAGPAVVCLVGADVPADQLCVRVTPKGESGCLPPSASGAPPPTIPGSRASWPEFVFATATGGNLLIPGSDGFASPAPMVS